jgi:outer membrane protein assembly factor BamB
MNRILIPALCSAAALAAHAADWPSWGGGDPGRNMFSPAKGFPAKFGPEDGQIQFKPNSDEVDLTGVKNLRWVAKMGSQTYGNPVIVQGKVLIGTNNAAVRDPRFTDDKSVLQCFDEKTGAFLWQLTVPKLASGKVNDWEYLGFLSTPSVEGDRLWVVSSRCEVLCLDLNGQANGNDGPFTDEGTYMPGPGKPKVEVQKTDADIIWRYDMMDELGVFPHNASNSSPLILDNRVYVCTSNGQDWSHVNIPSPQAPSFIVLDKVTGEFLGEDDAAIGPHIFHGMWTSPSAGKVDGKWQVFFGGGQGYLYGFNPEPAEVDGDPYLKKVWWLDAVPPEYKKDATGKAYKYPAPEGPSEIVATPVFFENRVYVAIGQDPEHGEGVGRLLCVDPSGKSGDLTQDKSALVWEFKDIKRSISTVAIDPATGLLFIADYSGYVYCLDARTGKLHWRHDMQAHIWGSCFVVDGKVYIGDEDGDVFVFAVSPEKKVLGEMNLAAAVYGTPVVANGTLYVNSQTHLYAVAEGATPAPVPAAAKP